jgi:hypothetical protein
MANHGVLIPVQIAAMNIDSLNRSVIDYGASASGIDNGWVLKMGAQHTSGSLTEVFEVSAPSSASPAGLWMAYSGDEIVLTDSKYKGLDPDPRHFYNVAEKVFSAYKPQIGDIIIATADCFSAAFSSNTYAIGQPDVFTLLWVNDLLTSGLCYKYIATTYISLATGAIDDQRETAYKLECISI